MEAIRRRRIKARARSKIRIKKKIRGSVERPRISVFRSSKHIYAQLIVDSSSKTIVSASTVEDEVRGVLGAGTSTKCIEAARTVGLLLAKRAKEKGVAVVVFDRNGLPYHGRVQGLADGAREGGLIF